VRVTARCPGGASQELQFNSETGEVRLLAWTVDGSIRGYFYQRNPEDRRANTQVRGFYEAAGWEAIPRTVMQKWLT
jgi:hypothetical protein